MCSLKTSWNRASQITRLLSWPRQQTQQYQKSSCKKRRKMYFQMPTQSAIGTRPQLGALAPARRRRVMRRGLGDPASAYATSIPGLLNNILAMQVFNGLTGAPAAGNVVQAVQQAMSQDQLWTSENCAGIVGSPTA